MASENSNLKFAEFRALCHETICLGPYVSMELRRSYEAAFDVWNKILSSPNHPSKPPLVYELPLVLPLRFSLAVLTRFLPLEQNQLVGLNLSTSDYPSERSPQFQKIILFLSEAYLKIEELVVCLYLTHSFRVFFEGLRERQKVGDAHVTPI